MRSNVTGRLWVGHLIAKNATDPKTFWDSWDVETFFCDGYNSTLSVRQQFVNGEQHVPVVENVIYRNPVNDSVGRSYADEFNVSFVDIGRQRVSYAVLSGLFEGTVYEEARAGRDFTSGTSVYNMPAFVKPKLASMVGRNDELQDALRPLAEQLSLNYTMSLLAYQDLGLRQMTTSNCTSTTYSNVWRYEKRNLIIAYSLGMVVSLISLVLGGVALSRNGVISEISFSQVLATTRNPELDKLVQGNCLGRSDLQPRSLYLTRLSLGELKEKDEKISASGARHAAFGIPDNVVPIRRRGYYI